jgi:hypothetical protein
LSPSQISTSREIPNFKPQIPVKIQARNFQPSDDASLLSLTPGFSRVSACEAERKPFQRFLTAGLRANSGCTADEAVETALPFALTHTGLKPGANENALSASRMSCGAVHGSEQKVSLRQRQHQGRLAC